MDETTDRLASILALRTNCGGAQTRRWLADAAEFGAGAAIAAGLAHGLLRDYAPPSPRASRATFTAIRSRNAGMRPSLIPLPVWAVGAEYRHGQRVRYHGRVFVARRDTWGRIGLEPDHHHDWAGVR